MKKFKVTMLEAGGKTFIVESNSAWQVAADYPGYHSIELVP